MGRPDLLAVRVPPRRAVLRRPRRRLRRDLPWRGRWGPVSRVPWAPVSGVPRGPVSRVPWGPVSRVPWGPVSGVPPGGSHRGMGCHHSLRLLVEGRLVIVVELWRGAERVLARRAGRGDGRVTKPAELHPQLATHVRATVLARLRMEMSSVQFSSVQFSSVELSCLRACAQRCMWVRALRLCYAML